MNKQCNGYSNFDTFIFMAEVSNCRKIDAQLKQYIQTNPLANINELAQHLTTYNPQLRKLNSHVNFSDVNYLEVAEQILQDLMESIYV